LSQSQKGHNVTTSLSQKTIMKFWAPLASTWLLMSLEGSVIAAIIARGADAKLNLAAYGVAFSLALIIESPVIMMLSASLALIRGRRSYQKLMNFNHALNFIITVMMLLILIGPIFRFLTGRILGLETGLQDLVYGACWGLVPWPAAIGYRRFWQGILIRSGKAKLIAVGTVGRLTAVLVLAILLSRCGLSGAVAGGASLGGAVVLEALLVRWFVRKDIPKILATPDETVPSYRSISSFYAPLAINSLLGLAATPMITFCLGRSFLAIESLAVWPVATAFLFPFRSFGLAYQEVVVALLRSDGDSYQALRTFAIRLGIALQIILAFILGTPAAPYVAQRVLGLPHELIDLCIRCMQFMFLVPALTLWITWQKSLLVQSHRTKPITWSSAIELGGIGFGLMSLLWWHSVPGCILATLALQGGRVLACLYLDYGLRGPWRQSIASHSPSGLIHS
jgi:progressive ankylosis protein